MFLTIGARADGVVLADAVELGHLLHKHPGRVQSFDLSVGTAHVFYPEATPARTTAALLLEVDPVGLVRDRKNHGDDFSLGQYVNDRPYAASSMLAAAMKQVFRTAMSGRCDGRQELADAALDLKVRVPALPCPGGAERAAEIFEPLGWTVGATAVPLDPEIPAWGDSRYVDLRLTGRLRLADALNHLYVLLPALDDAKHYWVAADEVDKLLRAGDGWLAAHPLRGWITRRYLAHRNTLTRDALGRLAETEPVSVDDDETAALDAPEDALLGEAQDDATSATAASTNAGRDRPDDVHVLAPSGERPEPLHVLRRRAVLDALRESGARSVADLGCGEGALVRDLLAEPAFERIVAVDVSARALRVAARKLRLDRLPERQRARLAMFQSSITYRDRRVAGTDAAVLMEVIEHVDAPRLRAVEQAVLGHARPGRVVVTTPNAEHNVRYESLEAGAHRHRDHRFEWTRGQFRAWADGAAAAHGYTVEIRPVGEDDPEVGPPTQMAVFDRPAPTTTDTPTTPDDPPATTTRSPRTEEVPA